MNFLVGDGLIAFGAAPNMSKHCQVHMFSVQFSGSGGLSSCRLSSGIPRLRRDSSCCASESVFAENVGNG